MTNQPNDALNVEHEIQRQLLARLNLPWPPGEPFYAIVEDEIQRLRSARSPHRPACACCEHILNEDLDRDALLWEVWANCPSSGCLFEMCVKCDPLGPAREFRESRNNPVVEGVINLESQ